MTYSNPIRFPALGISFDPNPVAFTIGSKPIYWYGIIIAAGFLLAMLYAMHRFAKEGINQDKAVDLILIATPISIVGARIYYVLFNLSDYQSFLDMLKIWNGGLAIYGGIITAFIVALVYCKKTGFKFLPFADIVAISFMIGQAVGRYGNLINREAYGTLCDNFLQMEIYSYYYGARVCVHPTFLYESAWLLLGIILLHFYSKRKKFDGEIFIMYIGWYGLGRSVIEGFRTDSLYLWGSAIRVSQLVGILSFIAAVAVLICLYRKKPYAKPALTEDTGGQEETDIQQADDVKQTMDEEIKTEETENGDTH